MDELIQKAKEGRALAYTPYSNFKVGAAILMKDGKYIIGGNIENAAYGLCNCAERTAIFSSISQGYKKEDVVAMCVIGDTKSPISPCGACRQVMSELLPRDTRIILANMKNETKEMKLEELLPYSFDDLQ